MKQPLISVCIVSYNHQAYIADCLSSVLGQYGNFQLEILLGDDTSIDDTVNIIRKIIAIYQGEAIIRLFAHEKNLGPSQNYQFLIAQAQGDFIAHLDGDDFWLPGKLQAQLDFLIKTPDCPACYSNAVIIKNDKSHWGFFNQTQKSERISTNMLLSAGNFLNHSSLLYRSQHKNDILLISEGFIDYRIHLKLSLHGDLGYINQALVAYRVNSTTSQLIMMKDEVLLMYIDSIISIKENVPNSTFNKSLLAFAQVYYLNLKINYRKTTNKLVLKKIKQHYPLDAFDILVRILPACILMEAKSFLYKKTFGRELRFLQRNGVN